MLIGTIIGLTMVIIISIIAEVRVMKAIQEQSKLHEEITVKENALTENTSKYQKLEQKYKELQEKHKEMRDIMKELIDDSLELSHDYAIVAKLLEKEIGEEEAFKRYEEKKNEAPKDINELLSEIKEGKGE